MPHETKRRTNSVARNVRLHGLDAHIAPMDDMSSSGRRSHGEQK